MDHIKVEDHVCKRECIDSDVKVHPVESELIKCENRETLSGLEVFSKDTQEQSIDLEDSCLIVIKPEIDNDDSFTGYHGKCSVTEKVIEKPTKKLLDRFNLKQLQHLLKKRGLKSTGTKNAMINRLHSNWNSTAAENKAKSEGEKYMSHPVYCCVPYCHMNSARARKEGMSMHRIPGGCERQSIRQQWISRLSTVRGNLILSENTRVCKRHFTSDCYDQNNSLKRESVPTIFPKRVSPKSHFKMRSVIVAQEDTSAHRRHKDGDEEIT